MSVQHSPSSRSGPNSRLRSGLNPLNPLALARAATMPGREGRIEDPVIARVNALRTGLGLAATMWLLLVYPLRKGRQDFVLGKLEDLVIGSGIVLAGGVVGVTVFVIGARSPLGRMYAARLVWPLRTVATILLGASTVWLTWALLTGHIQVDLGPQPHKGIFVNICLILLSLLGGLLCVVGFVAGLVFTVAATVRGLNSCFRTADVHELLPALISPLLVWSLFTLQLFDDADVAAPPDVLAAFLLGGPLSVTALSLWEARRLHTHYGITLRSALGR